MADLTLYFPSSGSAPHDCAYSDYWGGTAGAAHLPAVTSRGTTQLENYQTCTRNNGQVLGLGGQWVSAAQSARSWTTSDTFEITIYCRDVNEVGTSQLALSVRIFNAAGDTEVGVLYEGVVNTTGWATSATTRHNDGVAIQSNVSCPEGGHIVIEIGMSNTYAATFGNRIYVGEERGSGSGATAAPLNDTSTAYDECYPWIAFTYGAGGSDVEVPLTGVSGAASVGTLALSAALALSGIAGTAAVGTLGPNVSIPISGVEATAAVDSMSPMRAAVLAGIEAVDAAGGVGVDVTIPITGNEATGAAGTLNWNGSCSVGDVAPSAAVPLTGATGTGEVGTVTAGIGVGPDITLPLTGVSANPAYQLSGVSATGGVGTVSPVEASDIILPITGVLGTGSVGNVTYLTMGGEAMTGEIGDVTPNLSPPLTGAEATAAVGDVGQDRTSGLTGAATVGFAGGWVNTSRALTGESATGAVGTPGFSNAPFGPDALKIPAANTYPGSVVKSHSVALAGAVGTGVAGYMDTLVAGDVVRPLTGVAAVGTAGHLFRRTLLPAWARVNPKNRSTEVRPRKRLVGITRRIS